MSTDGPDEAGDREAASDAFQVLGNDTRVAILEALLAEDDEGGVTATKRTFSELYEATDEDTTAGFAYHLRQLRDRYVVQADEERYELTYAGLAVARELAAGTYTESVDRAVPIEDPCPFCEETALAGTVADNFMTVACEACGRDLLDLPFPPGGHRTHDDEALAEAFDALHRHRISLMTDGVCPECGGRVDATCEAVDDADDAGSADDTVVGPLRARFDCAACGVSLRCPLALTVLDHPAVVAFYADHGESIADRPVWNVGAEWRERLLSADPWAARVTTRLDDEVLALFVGRDGTVVETQRTGVGEAA